ncbi:MAG TPA: hypothetical protein VFX53_07320 [Pedococcus sp.]|nr:hypothetical protein [Pedococcus sp.]
MGADGARECREVRPVEVDCLRLDAPVDHPLADLRVAAVVDHARLAAAHRAANEADVLLIVGSEVGDSDIWGGQLAPGRSGGRTVVRVDLDPGQMHKNVRADLPVVGDAASVLADVLEVLRAKGAHRWDSARSAPLREAIEVEAVAGAPWAGIQRSLAQALPSDTVVAGDRWTLSAPRGRSSARRWRCR